MTSQTPNTVEWMVLYPTDPFYRIASTAQLATHLAAQALMSEPMADVSAGRQYSVGARFMELLVFTGCSPSVNSGDGDVDYNQYDIELPDSLENPALFTGSSNRSPQCPECRQHSGMRLIETRIIIDHPLRWECPVCDARVRIEQVDWKRKACVASSAIIIHGVHEGEAVPSDELLTDLQSYSGVPWSYCYCRGKP